MKKILCAVMILGLLITGCASAKNDSTEDYVVKINDEAVSKEEFNIYLFETQKSFEQFGGTDIWDTDFDGKSAEDVAKVAGIDLTDRNFWRGALDIIARQIDLFCELARKA